MGAGYAGVVEQTPQAQPVPRPEWFALPRPGSHGVEGKVLLDSANLVLALLRFGPQSTIDEHPAPFPIDVICLEGAGLFSVGGQAGRLRASERVQWPAHRAHRLWTEDVPMVTLMVEHRGASRGA